MARTSLRSCGVLFCALTALAGCSPVATEVIRRDLQQVGVASMPRGPHADGPLAPEDHVTLEGGLAVAPVETAATPESGTLLPVSAVSARLGIGALHHFEIGLDAEVAPHSWSEPTWSGASLERDPNAAAWSAGLQLRGLLLSDGDLLGVLLDFEQSITSSPFQRHIVETREFTPVYGRSVTSERDYWQSESIVRYHVRLGAGLMTSPELPVIASVGALVQSTSLFFWSQRADEACSFYEGGSQSCQGVDNPREVDPDYREWLLTTHTSIAYPLDVMTFIGSVWWHVAGPPQVLEAAPIGFWLGMRVLL